MSLIARVVELLRERGEAGGTPNELHADYLEDRGYSLYQVRRALENAHYAKRVRIERQHVGGGSNPARYFWQEPVSRPSTYRRPRRPPMRTPVVSPFQPEGVGMVWPPKFKGARVHVCWDDTMGGRG